MKNKIISNFKTLTSTALLFVANVLAVIFIDYFSTDVKITYWYNAIFIVIIVNIANSILWPVFRRFLMRFIIMTYGVGSLFISFLIFYISTYYIPGFHVGFSGFWQVPIVMAVATTFITNITNTNYYDSYIKNIFKYVSKQKNEDSKDYNGIIMIEIDGLSISTLKKAIDKNQMPAINNFIKNSSHRLKEWQTDLSSQTGASQAGILHGNNENIVAYRWVEKKNNNKICVSGSLSYASEIEEKISDGDGLLVNGISIANMFSGDSKFPILTSSKFKKIYYNKKLSIIFLNSYNFQRIFILFLWEILLEFKSQITHKIYDIYPRLRRGFIYATVRAGANVYLREITTEILTSEILTGEIDTAYATYMGYDEVAHHSGVEDRDVWGVLKQIDIQIQRIITAIDMSERDYEVVILSDHGQSNGATFKQRYGITLANYVRSLLPDDMKLYKNEYNIDHFRDAVIPQNNQFKSLFDNMFYFKNKKPKIIFENEQFKNLRNKYTNSLDYIRNHETKQQSTKKAKDSELIVLGSGNLGLIYLTHWQERLNYEEIVMLFPDLIPGLVKHSGIGFILVNSIKDGGMVIGDRGIYYLDSDEIVGENPLEDFEPNAAMLLKRQNSFDNMPDILVNSFYDSIYDEVCAFEELIGSHGGLGGNQSRAFILYPYEWGEIDNLIGAESIYKLLKRKVNGLKS